MLKAHSHYDHALDLVAVSKITGADIYGSVSTLNIARGGNISEDKLNLVDNGDSVTIGEFKVTIIRSKHSVPPTATTDQENDTIDAPLNQPATNPEFAMGGNFDFLIEHDDANILVKASANYIADALTGIEVDALFIGTAQLGMQTNDFQNRFIAESIESVSPKIIVPLHWDDFVTPWRIGALEFNPKAVDSAPAEGLNNLKDYAESNSARFYLLQGGDSILISR